jgi:hypothetical protein
MPTEKLPQVDEAQAITNDTVFAMPQANVGAKNHPDVEVKSTPPSASIAASEENAEDTIEQQTETPYKSSRWRRILGLFWDSVDGHPQERRYIQKLDTFMFSYMCLAYFIKQLGRTRTS